MGVYKGYYEDGKSPRWLSVPKLCSDFKEEHNYFIRGYGLLESRAVGQIQQSREAQPCSFLMSFPRPVLWAASVSASDDQWKYSGKIAHWGNLLRVGQLDAMTSHGVTLVSNATKGRTCGPRHLIHTIITMDIWYDLNTPINQDTLNREHIPEIRGHTSGFWMKGKMLSCIRLIIFGTPTYIWGMRTRWKCATSIQKVLKMSSPTLWGRWPSNIKPRVWLFRGWHRA